MHYTDPHVLVVAAWLLSGYLGAVLGAASVPE